MLDWSLIEECLSRSRVNRAYGYSIMTITINYLPNVTPPFCDKLAITVKIPPEDRPDIVQALKEHHAHPSPRYGFNIRVPVNEKMIPHLAADTSGDTVLLIQAAPRDPTHSFLRFEWNPAKVDSVMIVQAIEHFLPHLWSYKNLLDKAIVNRFDATVDVIGCPIDQLLVYSKKKQWSRVYSKSGKTLYLGDDGSEAQFCIYDKAAEIKAKNLKKCQQLKETVPTKPITRIEARLNPKRRLKDLPNRPNPFADLVVIGYPPKSLASPLAQLTLRLARYEGLDSVIKSLPSPEREQIKALLKPYHAFWWKPDAIWAQLPALLAQLADPITHAKVA